MKLTAVFLPNGAENCPCGNPTRSQLDVDVRPKKLNITTGNLVVREYSGEMDYDVLLNKPAINEHVLVGGENSLDDIGIGLARTADINRIFS